MSVSETVRRTPMAEAEANRILLVLFFLMQRGFGSVTNVSLVRTSLYRTPEDYMRVRKRLQAEGHIELLEDGRIVRLTDNGLETALKLLGIPNRNAVDVFIRRLRVFTLFPARLPRHALENLFSFLMLAYNDVCRRDFVADLLRSIAQDHREGLVERLRTRLVRAVRLLNLNDYRGEELYMSLLDGYVLMRRSAYLVRLWSMYRFNSIALHVVVRYGALVTSGWLGWLFTLLLGMVLMLLLLVILTMFSMKIPFDLFAVLMLPLYVNLFLVAAPRLGILFNFVRNLMAAAGRVLRRMFVTTVWSLLRLVFRRQ
ncbi:MAG: hypothetical protein QXO30_01700 [Candidatus Caldarchaeum sp.]